LTIREYPVILGDHPSVSSGAPLTLGWEYLEQSTRNLELYEYTRQRRRTRRQLAIPVDVRGQILLKMGYTIEELANATMEVEDVKRQRAESMRSSNMMDRTKLVLTSTGELPKNVVNGMAKLFTVNKTPATPIKPQINKAAARSA
jgi:hypothetical protein